MQKVLNFSQKQIDDALNSLKKHCYEAKVKENFPDTNISIVVYTDKEFDGENIDKIVQPILGTEIWAECWDYGVYYISVGYFDTFPGESAFDPIDVRIPGDYPHPGIAHILEVWKDFTEQEADNGTCYFPDSITLNYQGKYYRIHPLDGYQSAVRRQYWSSVREMLTTLGCSNIEYHAGSID